MLEKMSEYVFRNIHFFRACRSKLIESTLSEFNPHATQISKICCAGGRMEAYVLPTCIAKWPSFRGSKQTSVKSPNIYFKRVSESNGPRLDETVTLLREGSISWFVGNW